MGGGARSAREGKAVHGWIPLSCREDPYQATLQLHPAGWRLPSHDAFVRAHVPELPRLDVGPRPQLQADTSEGYAGVGDGAPGAGELPSDLRRDDADCDPRNER